MGKLLNLIFLFSANTIYEVTVVNFNQNLPYFSNIRKKTQLIVVFRHSQRVYICVSHGLLFLVARCLRSDWSKLSRSQPSLLAAIRASDAVSLDAYSF